MGPTRVDREVFLAGTFDTANWTTVAGANAPIESGQVGLFGAPLVKVALASVLLAALLSLTQIRRMLVPLERLTSGARSLATGRFDTRIQVSSRDEFGQLAVAFNEMAAQLRRQFIELDTLAAIDRTIIVQQPDSESLLRDVTARRGRPAAEHRGGRRAPRGHARALYRFCGRAAVARSRGHRSWAARTG